MPAAEYGAGSETEGSAGDSTIGSTDLAETLASAAALRLPALTILAHPDLERVGERVLLSELAMAKRVDLSRAEPRFAPPSGGHARALADRFLSRTPIRLCATDDGGVGFERAGSPIPLSVAGEPLRERLVVPAADVERGTPLVLGERIALLLHRAAVDRSPAPPSFGLVGESDAIVALRRALARVAAVDVAVLVRGATGSGKELVARALHQHGPRPNGPFVAVNLGAVAPSLAVAELFGVRKGAFTGAVRDQPGHFIRAHGGTLFLDEVGEAPPELQVMLLRTLETGEVMAVGGQTPQRPEVRWVAATDAPLEARVAAGTFRAPLLHRLAGYRLDVPPLAARRDDVGRLLVHFLREERQRLDEPEPRADLGARSWLDPVLVARLALHDWPGNVRELRNVARELAIDSRGGDGLVVSARLDASLPRWSGSDRPPVAVSAAAISPPRRQRKPSEVGEDELLAVLRAHRFDLQATAHALGVSRTGLYARIERSPNVRAAADVPEEEIRRAHEEHGGQLDAMVAALEVSERALRQRLKDLRLRSRAPSE